MKKWKTLFLCLLLNCNIEKDQHQAPVNKTEIQEITKMTYENFAVLDRLRNISEILNFTELHDDNGNLNFFCNCSSQNLNTKKDKILEILNKKLSEGRLKDLKNILQHFSKECMEKSILHKYNIPEKDDITQVLYDIIRQFLTDSMNYFENLKKELGKYKKNVENIEKLKNSVEAFDKLSGYLRGYLNSCNNLVSEENEEHLISLFFCNILPQYYNVYDENIFRLKQQTNGEYAKNLSLVDAIQ